MKNFKLNPEAKNIDFSIETTFEVLEELGWDFDGVQNREGHYPVIRLKNQESNGRIFTDWYAVDHEKGITSEPETTGDDYLTLQNVIEKILPEVSDDDIHDDSTNDDLDFVPTFISI